MINWETILTVGAISGVGVGTAVLWIRNALPGSIKKHLTEVVTKGDNGTPGILPLLMQVAKDQGRMVERMDADTHQRVIRQAETDMWQQRVDGCLNRHEIAIGELQSHILAKDNESLRKSD